MAAGAMTVRLSLVSEEWEKQWKKAAKSIENFGKDMEKVGKALSMSVTAPIAGFAAAALASSEKAKKAFESFSATVKTAMGKVGDAIMDAGLESLMKKVADGVKKAADWFDGLSSTTKKYIIVIGAFVAAVGPALIVIGKLTQAIATMMAVMAGPAGVVAVLGTLAAIAGGALAAGLLSADSATNSLRKSLEGLSLAELDAELASLDAKISGLQAKLTGGTRTVIGLADTYEEPLSGAEMAEIQKKIDDLKAQRSDASIRSRNYMMANPVGPPLPDRLLPRGNAAIAMDEMSAYGPRQQMELVQAAQEYRGAQADANAEMQRGIDLAGTFGFQLADAFRNTVPLSTQIAGAIKGVFDQLAAGIGNSIAQLLVYGGSFAEMMKAMLKQVLASIISTFVQMAIQYVIGSIAAKAFASLIGAVNIGVSTARAAAAAVAAGFESFGLYGFAAAGPLAEGAIAATTAAAAEGKIRGMAIGAAAEGGFALSPQMLAVAERGRPEAVMNEQNMKRIFPAYMGSGSAGGNGMVGQLVVDGEVIGEAVMRYLPTALRRQGLAR